MVALIAFMSKRRKISKIINISESNDDFTVRNIQQGSDSRE